MTVRLKCTWCYCHKPRTDFRETPWHGRAAACWECEGRGDRQRLFAYERQRWELAQERERARMYRRHISYLRLRRIFDVAPRSADVIRDYEEPYTRAVARASDRWTRALAFAVTTHEEYS